MRCNEIYSIENCSFFIFASIDSKRFPFLRWEAERHIVAHARALPDATMDPDAVRMINLVDILAEDYPVRVP